MPTEKKILKKNMGEREFIDGLSIHKPTTSANQAQKAINRVPKFILPYFLLVH